MNQVIARQPTPTLTSAVLTSLPSGDSGQTNASAAEWLAAYLLAVILDDDHRAMQHVRYAMQQVAHRTQEINA